MPRDGSDGSDWLTREVPTEVMDDPDKNVASITAADKRFSKRPLTTKGVFKAGPEIHHHGEGPSRCQQ